MSQAQKNNNVTTAIKSWLSRRTIRVVNTTDDECNQQLRRSHSVDNRDRQRPMVSVVGVDKHLYGVPLVYIWTKMS